MKFFKTQHIKNLNDTFLINSKGKVKGKVKVEKHHLVAERKLEMSLFASLTFSISALPPGDVFQLRFHFSKLWTFGQTRTMVLIRAWLTFLKKKTDTNSGKGSQF